MFVKEKGKKTLIEMLLEAGYEKKDIFHHESDLYVFVTDTTTKVIREWLVDNGYNVDILNGDEFLLTKFRDQITGKLMYDIAFQYYEVK